MAAKTAKFTMTETAALFQAGAEILAGDGSEWKVKDWEALRSGVQKLAIRAETKLARDAAAAKVEKER